MNGVLTRSRPPGRSIVVRFSPEHRRQVQQSVRGTPEMLEHLLAEDQIERVLMEVPVGADVELRELQRLMAPPTSVVEAPAADLRHIQILRWEMSDEGGDVLVHRPSRPMTSVPGPVKEKPGTARPVVRSLDHPTLHRVHNSTPPDRAVPILGPGAPCVDGRCWTMMSHPLRAVRRTSGGASRWNR